MSGSNSLFKKDSIVDGRYKLKKLLGKGGMGEVWLAFDLKLKKNVAIKTIISSNREAELKKRLLREAIVAGQIEHPNICTVYDIVEKDDYSYIVMQYLDGTPLNEMLKKKKLSINEALDIAIQIAKGLSSAHKKGIVHRDIKPSNIIITKDGTVKILDFGLAKPFLENYIKDDAITREAEDLSPDYSLTESGVIVGTVSYMSPEQATGKEVDHRSDIFSFGIILYEMLTGEKPFKGDSQITIIANIIKDNPEPIENYGDFPKDIISLMKKLLEKNPDKRFQSMDEVINKLEEIKTNIFSQTKKMPIKKTKKRKIPQFFEVAIVTLIVLSISLCLLFMHRKPSLIVIEGYTVSDGVKRVLGSEVEFLLKKMLFQIDGVEVVDNSVYDDIKKRWGSKEKTIKKENIIAFVSGKIERIGDMINIETYYFPSNSSAKKIITTNGKGEKSILDFQIDNITRRISYYVNPKRESSILPVKTVLTKNWLSFSHFFKGFSLWKDVDPTNSKRFFLKSIKADSEFPLPYYYLAEIEIFNGNRKKAEEYIKIAKKYSSNLVKIDKLNIDALYNSLEYRFDEQIKSLKKIVELTPRNKFSYYLLGEAYFHRGRVKEAKENYKKALLLSPDFSPALNHLGYCYMYEGEHMKAVETLEKYKEISGGANAFDSLGDAYFYMGDYLNAENNKKTAINIDPKMSWVYYSLGYILFMEKKFDELKKVNKTYEKVDKRKRTKILSLFQKAFLSYLLGDLKNAQKYYSLIEKYYSPKEISELIPEVDYGRIAYYSEKKDFKKAQKIITLYENIIKKYNINFKNYLSLYKFYIAGKAEYNYFKNKTKEFKNLYNSLIKEKEKIGYWATFFNYSYFLWRYADLLEKAGFREDSQKTFSLLDSYNSFFRKSITFKRD